MKILLLQWTLSVGMHYFEVSASSSMPRMTPRCFRMKALSRLSKGGKWQIDFGSQIHVCLDNSLVHHFVWCDHHEVVKSAVQVSIIYLTAEASNMKKDLVEEVVFG